MVVCVLFFIFATERPNNSKFEYSLLFLAFDIVMRYAGPVLGVYLWKHKRHTPSSKFGTDKKPTNNSKGKGNGNSTIYRSSTIEKKSEEKKEEE